MNFAGRMIAEIMVEFSQRLRQIPLAVPVGNIEPFVGVGVIQVKPVFARREGRRQSVTK